MPTVFGEAFWPGAVGFISCSYTVSHGISPGVATLVVPLQDTTRFDRTGTLVIRDGVREPVLLKDCLLQSAAVVAVPGGKALALTILDRRWEWRSGWIDGDWNVLDPYPDSEGLPPGDVVNAGGGGNEQEIQVAWGPFVPGTEQPVDSLMAKCLDAMDEPEWDIKRSPNAFPTVNWYGTNPAAALQQLADPLGLRVVFRPNADKVLVDAVGVTGGVPADWPVIEDHPGCQAAAAPDSAIAFAAPSWFADFLPLEDVGQEHNGEFVPISQLSYRPGGGWQNSFPDYGYYPEQFNVAAGGTKGNCDTTVQAAELASRYVYKAFRVIASVNEPLELDAFPVDLGGPIEHRRRIILAGQVYTPEKDATGQFRTKPGWAAANSYRGYTDKQGKLFNFDPRGRLDIPYSVDAGRGLVLFARPIFRMVQADPWEITAADLRLFTSFRIRSVDDNSLLGTSRVKVFGAGGGKLPESLSHPELATVWMADRTSSTQELQNVLTNEADVRNGLEYFLDKSREKYEIGLSTTRTYAGIYPIDPDGGIQQITWSVGGGQPATTTVSVNGEHAHWLPPFAQRRRFEKLDRFG